MAKPMTPQEVFELAGLLSQMQQDQIDEMIRDLRREQPDLYDYFDSLHRLFPDAGEWNEVVGICYTTWQILKHSPDPPGRVTVEMLAQANGRYLAEIRRLTALPEEARKKAVTEVALSYPEPAMLAYLIVAMKQVGSSWGEQTITRANNALRVLLDALLASRGRPARRASARRAPPGRA